MFIIYTSYEIDPMIKLWQTQTDCPWHVIPPNVNFPRHQALSYDKHHLRVHFVYWPLIDKLERVYQYVVIHKTDFQINMLNFSFQNLQRC